MPASVFAIPNAIGSSANAASTTLIFVFEPLGVQPANAIAAKAITKILITANNLLDTFFILLPLFLNLIIKY